MMDLTENEISKIVVNIAFSIHTRLGPGLFESVYEHIFIIELEKRGLKVEVQKAICVYWDDKKIDRPAFRADLIINEKILVEIKSVEKLADIHFKQILTYLKVTGLKLGLLINLNEPLMKYGIHRVVNGL